jgi:hypothetical protein
MTRMGHKCPVDGALVSRGWDNNGSPVPISLIFLSIFSFICIGGKDGA